MAEDLERQIFKIREELGLNFGKFVVGLIETKGNQVISCGEARDLKGLEIKGKSLFFSIPKMLSISVKKEERRKIKLRKVFCNNYGTVSCFEEISKSEGYILIRGNEEMYQQLCLPLFEKLAGNWQYREFELFLTESRRLITEGENGR